VNARDAVNLAILGLVGYAAYKFLYSPKGPTQTAANIIADFITWATLPPAMTLNGNLVFADGSTVALQDVDVRSNGGMVVANYAGHYYQLAPSDASGNWPATLIQ
jgi:hypothetical protein